MKFHLNVLTFLQPIMNRRVFYYIVERLPSYMIYLPPLSHDWGKSRDLNTTNKTYTWSFVTLIFRNVNQVMVVSHD